MSAIEVTAAIIQKDDKVLITRRGIGKHLAGFWEFPGGKIEENETHSSCLSREILEELGIEIINLNYFATNKHAYGEKNIILHAYLCELGSNTVIKLIDHDDFAWIKINQLLDYKFAPADIPFIHKLLKHA